MYSREVIQNNKNSIAIWKGLIGLLAVWVLWHITLCWLFNAKSIFYTNYQFYFKQFSLAWVHSLIVKNIYFKLSSLVKVLFKTIQFSISIVSVCTQLNVKTVLFQTFNKSPQFGSVWPIDQVPPIRTRVDLGVIGM